MAKVYALVEFTDPSGTKREIGEGFDLPRETDEQKRAYGQLLDYGVVSKDNPMPESKADSEPDEGQRTRRSRG